MNRVDLWSFPKAVFAWPLAFSGGAVLAADALVPGRRLGRLAATGLRPARPVRPGPGRRCRRERRPGAAGGPRLLLRLVAGTGPLHLHPSAPAWQALKGLVTEDSPTVAVLSLASGAFLVLYALLRAFYDGRWQVTPNEFQRKVTLRRHESHARGAKTVQAEFPDLLEWLLGFGAGTLTVRDPRNRRVIERVPHVFFLTSKVRRIERLLELREVLHAEDDGSDDDEKSL